jgi:hypothetical protein
MSARLSAAICSSRSVAAASATSDADPCSTSPELKCTAAAPSTAAAITIECRWWLVQAS